MRHYNVTFKPEGRRISIHAGATLFEAAGQAGIILNTVCGGRGICKKCVVNLRRKASPSGEPKSEAVLACQYHIESDITVTIPAASRFFEQKILTEGIGAKAKDRLDVWEKYKDAGEKIFGLAVDIGTTTVVVKLLNMKDGRCLATQAELNPQTRYGDDVISRIAYAQSDDKSAELHKAITDCINKLIGRLCKQAHIDGEHIYEVCVVGNTTMNHIFLKFPVAQLGQAPYKAFSVEAHERRPNELGLSINPAGNIYTVENIAGFVGSDITAVALAAGIDSADEMTLIVDIGTNGEIVLGTGDPLRRGRTAANKLYAASCAAGPALEGARISCGSRASEGTIEAVIVNDDDIDLDVIGSQPPRSICGSGLIDAVAVLLELSIIDRTGRFTEAEKLKGSVSSAILSRITKQKGQPAFVLALNQTTSLGSGLADKVILTQQDIREVQLAKAAIRTGIKLLQKKNGVSDDDIRHIYLAGAFGNYIRAESALRIGLLPNVPAERIHFIGNAACSGAQMILLNSAQRAEAKQLAHKIKYIEIAHEPEFQDVFADSMMF